MRQEIYDDPYDLDDWDLEKTSRCFVHIANSMVWQSITGKRPPLPPPTAKEYTEHGLPWFDWYDDRNTAVDATDVLSGLKSVVQVGKAKGGVSPLPENETVAVQNVNVLLAEKPPEQVREWRENE